MSHDRRRRLLTEDETRLWREAMKGAKAYPGRVTAEGEAPPPPPDLSPLPPPPEYRPREVVPPPRGVTHRLDHGTTAGIDRRTADRMKKGEMSIDGTIDLHGLIQDAAYLALHRFVLASAEMERRCLLVVTGKGSKVGAGVLRSQVPRWLNEPALRPFVLAFSYAQPRHGGDGALYVLLKRRR